MQHIKVAVLRGGPSFEYDISLKSGKNIIENLPDKCIPTDVFISKDGFWYVDGVPIEPAKVFQSVDVIFNALHGQYGEDGKVQQLLDNFKVKYTGSGALASSLGMNKIMAKKIFKEAGLKTPVWKLIKKEEFNHELPSVLFKTFPMPAIIKPNGSGSSMGVSLVKAVKDIEPALKEAFKYADNVIVEEYISGKEATCGVIENFRGKKLYPLLPVEIVKSKELDIFDYETKYSGVSREICPGSFSKKESDAIQEMIVKAHHALGLRHYSRADFIVNPKRGVYILEINTLPGLTKESLIPKELKAIGSSMSEFLDHVIRLAIEQ